MFKINVKRIILFSMISMPPALSLAATHNINVINSSSTAVTASMKGTCSDSLGKKGILEPGQSYAISPHLINLSCSFEKCMIITYASRNCKGEKIATIEVSGLDKDGVVKVVEHNKGKYILDRDAHFNYVKLMDAAS